MTDWEPKRQQKKEDPLARAYRRASTGKPHLRRSRYGVWIVHWKPYEEHPAVCRYSGNTLEAAYFGIMQQFEKRG